LAEANRPERAKAILLITVFVAGLSTILYELLIGTVSSYLLGDSVKQFSLTIGLSMSAMGVGSWASRLFKNHLLFWFIFAEVCLGVVGGLSVPTLYLVYGMSDAYTPVMIAFILSIGFLIGLEIPLLTRLMEGDFSLRENISNVLSLDYLGALVATLLFPFVLLPFLGIFRGSLVVALLNFFVALLCLWYFKAWLKPRGQSFLKGLAGSLLLLDLVLFFNSKSLLHSWESSLYQDRVIFSEQSPYQKIVLTKNRDDLRLFLDGNLQFSSQDEYRYHEALIHIPLSLAARPEEVLILGGGDGLAVRELLKYPKVRGIDLVDLDRAITELAQQHPRFLEYNQGSLSNRKVTIHNQDAFRFLEKGTKQYQVIFADLPDPKNVSLSRLYSKEFDRLIEQRLAPGGIFVTQATSPFFARKAFWSIKRTLSEVFPHVRAYHLSVPSMGDWGFVMAARHPLEIGAVTLPPKLRYLTGPIVEGMFLFGRDVEEISVQATSLNDPKLLEYYLQGWKKWR